MSSTSIDAGAAPAGLPATATAGPVLLVGAACAMTFPAVSDGIMINIAQQYVGGSFGVAPTQVKWLMTILFMGEATAMPAADWVFKRFGRTRALCT